MPAGLPGAPPSGKPPAPARPSQGGAPGPAVAPCQDSSGVQPRRLCGQKLWYQEGQRGQGMAFCMVSPAAGPRLSRTEETQVSSRPPVLTVAPLRRPHFSWQPRPGTGAGMAARAGPAPGRQPSPAQLTAALELRDTTPGSCSHPAKHNLGAPGGEGALDPALTACPRQLWSACRVNVRPHVTLKATGTGLPGLSCFLLGPWPTIAAAPWPTGMGG